MKSREDDGFNHDCSPPEYGRMSEDERRFREADSDYEDPHGLLAEAKERARAQVGQRVSRDPPMTYTVTERGTGKELGTLIWDGHEMRASSPRLLPLLLYTLPRPGGRPRPITTDDGPLYLKELARWLVEDDEAIRMSPSL